MSTRRTQRVAQSLKQAISQIVLFELSDPRMEFCTITDVRVSPDLKVAEVDVSIAGNEATQNKCFKAIEHARGYIQKSASKMVRMRYCPTFKFHLDKSVTQIAEISELLRKTREEDERARKEAQGPGAHPEPQQE